MIKNILLDLDDTILDFKKCEHVALDKALTVLGVPHDESTIKLYSKINDLHWKKLETGELTRNQVLLGRFEMLFEKIGVQCSGKKAWKTYEEMLSNQYFFVAGAVELLENLKDKYDLYIVSNGTASVQDRRIAGAHLEKYFKKIFISQRVGINKPDIRFFERCFAEIPNLNKDETIIVGDSLSSDIQGGINAGIKTCWYNPHNLTTPDNMKINYVIGNLEELYDVLKKEK